MTTHEACRLTPRLHLPPGTPGINTPKRPQVRRFTLAGCRRSIDCALSAVPGSRRPHKRATHVIGQVADRLCQADLWGAILLESQDGPFGLVGPVSGRGGWPREVWRMRRILNTLVGRSAERAASSIPVPAVPRHAWRFLPPVPVAESKITMAVSSTNPARRRWISNLPTCALLCAVVLVPLLNTPDHLIWFDITPKIAAMLLMVGIASVSIPSELLDSPITPRWSIFFPASMIIVAVLSTAFSRAPFLSLGGSSWRRVGLPTELALAVFLILQTATARDNSRCVIWCLRANCVALLFSSVAVLLQVLGIWANVGFESWQDTVRPGGFLGSGAAFGCYATAPIFLCATLRLIDKESAWRYLPFIAGTAGFSALLFSGTRAGLLGVLIGVLVSFVLLRRRAAEIVASTLVGLALTFGLALTTHTPLLVRLQQVRLDQLGATRPDVWKDSLALLSSLPPFGYGLESFPRIYPKVQSQQTALDWPNTFHESPHNYLLDIVLSRGIPGLVIAFGLSITAFLKFRQLSTEKKRPYSFCLAGHIACLASCMFFTPQLSTLLYLYLPVCLIWASSNDDHHSFKAAGQALWVKRPSPLGRLRTILLRGSGLAFIVYSVCLVVWDSRVHETKVLLDSGQIDSALKSFARARQIAPPGVTAEAWFSRELIGKANSVTSDALRQQLYYSLRVAVTREEEFGNASVLLASKMIADRKLDEASTVLSRTILEFPNWELPKNILSGVQASKRSGRE